MHTCIHTLMHMHMQEFEAMPYAFSSSWSDIFSLIKILNENLKTFLFFLLFLFLSLTLSLFHIWSNGSGGGGCGGHLGGRLKKHL